MPSFTQRNGSALLGMTTVKLGNHSSDNTPQLPSFNSSRPGIDARHTYHRHRELDARYRIKRYIETSEKARARGRILWNLAMMSFIVFAVFTAAYALRVDREQQQQWERIH